MDWDLYHKWFWSGPDYPFVWLLPVIVVFHLSYIMRKNSHSVYFQESTKRLCKGYSIFFFCYSFTRIFFLFSDFYAYNNDFTNEEFIRYIRIAYFVSGIGFAWLIGGLEHYFLNAKYIIFCAIISLTIGIIFLPYSIYQILTYIVLLIIFIFLSIVYLIAFLREEGPVKKRIFFTIIDTGLFYLCVILDSRLIKNQIIDTKLRWISFIFPAFLVTFALMGMTHNIIYLDHSLWFFHLLIYDNESGELLFEQNFKEIEMDQKKKKHLISSILSFSKTMKENDVGMIIYGDYKFFVLKFINFSFICSTGLKTKKKDIVYYLKTIGRRYKEEYPTLLENYNEKFDTFSEFSKIIEKMMQKRPIYVNTISEKEE